MGNFNKNKVTQSSKGFKPTVNHEGTTVHKLTDLETLFSQVLGSFFGEETHYENRTTEDEFNKLYERVRGVDNSDKEYVLKIAEIGRLCNMIDYPLNILTVAFNDDKFLGTNFADEGGRNKLWDYADKIILRAKDITTVMSSHLTMFDKRSSMCIDVPGKKGTAIPMQMRKCLKKKLQMYDKFKLSKGLCKGSYVTLADCINLLRPKPRNTEFAEFFKSIKEGKVKIGDDKAQIKTELVKKGQKRAVEVPVDNEGLGKAVSMDNLMNIVKNLVSLYKNGVFEDKEALSSVCSKLRNPKEVKQSRLLPFRFYSAYVEVDKLKTDIITKTLKEALSDALDLAVSNVEPLEGLTCILVDRSGSMDHRISSKSVMTAHEIASVLAAIAYKSGMADLYAFSNYCVKVSISNTASVMDITRAIEGSVSEEGTQLEKALKIIERDAASNGTKYDSLLMLSDGDCYGYDKSNNTLTFSGGYEDYGVPKDTPDKHINRLISVGLFKRVWLANLLGNDFAVFNTSSDNKNLIVGFSEQCLNMISVYNMMGGNKDIRKVIDKFYDKLKGKPVKVED